MNKRRNTEQVRLSVIRFVIDPSEPGLKSSEEEIRESNSRTKIAKILKQLILHKYNMQVILEEDLPLKDKLSSKGAAREDYGSFKGDNL